MQFIAYFLLVARSDHTTGSRNIKPEVVFKVQKMARCASFGLIIGPFKGGSACFCQIMAVSVRVRVSFKTEAVRSAILATAGLLVEKIVIKVYLSRTISDVLLMILDTFICIIAAAY